MGGFGRIELDPIAQFAKKSPVECVEKHIAEWPLNPHMIPTLAVVFVGVHCPTSLLTKLPNLLQ